MYIYKHIYIYSCPLYIYLYIYIHVYLHTGSLMYMCACGSRRTEEKEDRLVAYHSLSLNLCPTHSSHTLLHTDNPQAQSTENTSPQKTPTNKTQHIQKTQDTHTQKRDTHTHTHKRETHTQKRDTHTKERDTHKRDTRKAPVQQLQDAAPLWRCLWLPSWTTRSATSTSRSPHCSTNSVPHPPPTVKAEILKSQLHNHCI